jgi:hypothetical protein
VRNGVFLRRILLHLYLSSLTFFYGTLSNLTNLTSQKTRTSIPNLMLAILSSILQTHPNSTSLPSLSLQKSSNLMGYQLSLRKKLKLRRKNGQSSSSDFLITRFVLSFVHILYLPSPLTHISLDHPQSKHAYRVHGALSASGHYRYLRGQPKGLRSAALRIPKMEFAWYLQAETWCSCRHGTRTRERLAAGEYHCRGRFCFTSIGVMAY